MMSKRLLFLISVVLLLSLAGNALAVYYVWDNDKGTGDRRWDTPENWEPNGVPIAGDWAELEAYYVDEDNGLIIDANTDATCEWLTTGYYETPAEGNAVVIMTGGKVNADAYIGFGFTGGNHRFDISGGDVTTGGDFYVADEGTGTGVVNMSGGTITIGEDLQIGEYGSTTGTFNMSGGQLNVPNEQIYVGFYQSPNPALFNMTGGEANTYELHIGNTWGDTPIGVGHVKLHGGTMYAEDLAIGGEGNCSLDITDGVFVASADLTVPNGYLFNPGVDDHADVGSYTGTIPILIAKGIITAYDVNHGEIITDDVNYPAQADLRAVVKVDYDVTNPGKTTLSAMTCDPNLAWNENPSSGSTWQPQIITLSWSPGDNAASHDLYFGSSFNDVNNGTGGTFIDNLDTNSYSPGEPLILDTAYYWRIDEVNASGLPEWKGIIWNFKVAPGAATSPSPGDGATEVPPLVVLSWTPGIEAVSHKLYFSTDFNDVNDRLITPVTPGANSYDPGALQFETTYYWAVDEVNLAADVNVWAGDVWSFTTTDHLVVDDFDSYVSNTELYDVWDDYWTNSTGSEIFIEKDPDLVYEGNSLRFVYENTYTFAGKQIGSRIDADTIDLDVGSDWTAGGAKALWLVFAGEPGNSATTEDRMWVELEDTSSNTGVARYDGDPNDVKKENYQEWSIDLGIFDACGVSLSNIAKVHIGFGGPQGGQDSKTPGGSGTVFFDRIEIWPPYCRSELVTADITGDCVTNSDDLELLAADWLLYDYNFIAAEPCEANLIGWWKLDEGSGTITVDSSIYGNDGNIIEAIWTTGHPNDPCNSALDFDGDGVVTFDHVLCAERVNDLPGIYPAELMPDEFTVTCWARLDSFEYFSSFVGNGMDTGSDECGFFFYNWGWEGDEGPDFGLAIRTEAGMYYVETEPIYDTKTWYHLATTYDGNYATIYVDGQLAAGPEDVGGPIRWISEDSNNYPERFTIGVWLDPGYSLYVNGVIDDVRFYNVPLSQGDIAVLGAGIPPGTELYQPVPSFANIIDPEPPLSRKVNFMDYCILADNWLVGPVLWPSP
jgi:hypothetical protein